MIQYPQDILKINRNRREGRELFQFSPNLLATRKPVLGL